MVKSLSKFYILDEDLAIPLGNKNVSWDSSSQDWFYISEGVWFMQAGIIWDGATFVPDGKESETKKGYPEIWLATLIHDLGRYSLEEGDFPYTGSEIHCFFYEQMKAVKSPLALPYFIGVKLFGGIWESAYRRFLALTGTKRRFPSHVDDENLTEWVSV